MEKSMKCNRAYRIYSKPMNTTHVYEITGEEVNLVSLQDILDRHQIGRLISMLVVPQSNTVEIRLSWKTGFAHNSLVMDRLYQYVHVNIPETNLWIYRV